MIGISSTAGPMLAPEVRRKRGDVKRERYVETGEGRDGSPVITAQGERDRVQNMVRRYWRRQEIGHRQFLAGDRLAQTAELVGTDVKSCLNPDKLNGSRGGGDLHEAMMAQGGVSHDARIRCRRALDALGPQLAPVVSAVCIWGKSATDWATEQGKPKTDGIALLRAGLTALADHYWPVKKISKKLGDSDDVA